MKEYIERSAAVKAAQDGADEWDGGFNRNRDAYIEAAIDKVPTVHVEKGRYPYPKIMTIQLSFSEEEIDWLKSKFDIHSKEDLNSAVWECISTYMEL